MTSSKKILICGGGIAGPACAYWLRRYGFSVVIVEKAMSFRDGGQNVDVKGAGQQVIRRMGLDDQVQALNTGECGQKWLDANGKVVAVFPKDGFGSLTSDFEILRGDFARLLFEATRDSCEYRFGRHVTDIVDGDEGALVIFDDGTREAFSLVICAEGLSSSTRSLKLEAQTRMRHLGAWMAFFKIPKHPGDDLWAHSVNGIGGTMINLRPGGATETTALVTFPAEPAELDGTPRRSRRELLVAALQGRGTIADRLIDALDTVQDFYFGPMSQVQASTWSVGRLVLLGDAAHCPTPFTGKGTALSLVGAYVLAGELSKAASHTEAFRAYEALLRPYAERCQQELSPRFVRLMHVRTPVGIAIARLLQRFFGSAPMQRLLTPSPARRARQVEEDFVLPVY
ncbi:FAD-dependent monooxygenase [Roseateles chitinivorans]|uniref:FAD-dependent monooxygenase n=1 Tax=Roseateles chitinivorans TaxID=2917965 RepID=UPI003D665A12